MSNLALLFVGAVLLVNGLVFLGKIDGKAAIPVNLLVGAVLVLTALLQVSAVELTSPDYRAVAFGAAGFTLFGFTYLTVGGNSLFGGSGTGLGWYCGWASVIAAVLAIVNFTSSGGTSMGWLWASWSVLFASFFLALITGAKGLTVAAGWLAILQSFTTATIPALLMINGSWETTSLVLIAVIQIAVVVAYIVVAALLRGASEKALT